MQYLHNGKQILDTSTYTDRGDNWIPGIEFKEIFYTYTK
jgi:hypothetical protein